MAFIVSLAYLKAIKKNGAAQQSRTEWNALANGSGVQYIGIQQHAMEYSRSVQYIGKQYTSRTECNALEYSILIEQSTIHWNAVESCGIHWNTVSAQQSLFGRCL